MWRSSLVLLSVLGVLFLAGIVGFAQTIDPNDNFDDGVIDTTKWGAYCWPGAGGSIVERDGKLVMTLEPTEVEHHDDLASLWRLRGPFDIQVDFQLIGWPATGPRSLGLFADPPGDLCSVQRGCSEDGHNSYLVSYLAMSSCICGASVGTEDQTGTLRLVRDADSLLSAYQRSTNGGAWFQLAASVVPSGDMLVSLSSWAQTDREVVVAFDDFQVNSGEVVTTAPVIEDVVIDRGRDADWWDWPMWHARFTVQVYGSQYEQPSMLWVEDMQGGRHVINTDGSDWYDPAGTNPGGSVDCRVIPGPNYTYTYVYYEARKEGPIPAGSYKLTVVGSAGSQISLTTPALPAVPDAVPTLTGPTADSVIETAVPTFQWLPLSGAKGTLQVRAEGDTTYTGPAPDQDDCGQIWRVPLSPTGPASAVYNFDGKGPALDPGRTYFWQISDWTPVDDRVSDPRVSVWNDQTSRHRFTVDTTWPALPVLPGKLAYEQTMYGNENDPYNLQAILQYGTTPSERKWVGPDASHTPSYSWDGTKIAYRISDWGIRVANADGSDPVRLPNMWGWDSAEFSPDATWMTYIDTEIQGTPPLNVYTQKLYAPTRTLLVANRGKYTSKPHWSPDGKWIAYLSCCDPSGSNLWLIHPDGTQDHPVLPTTLAGYPGWTVRWLGSSVGWSADATRLGVNFSATSPDGGASLAGVGIISPDGGEVTPVFINPPGYVCCAAASFLCWSPSGGAVVFSSAHHLPVNPDWGNGAIEPGLELWMISADGSGEPTRLTYDYSYVASAAWWAPNTPTGSSVAIIKGDATVTFDTVTAEGSTAMCVTPDVLGPAPDGYAFLGDCWELLTNGAHTDGLSLVLAYRDVEVPTGAESTVRLLAWEDGRWRNITRALAADDRVVAGRSTSATYFTLALAQQTFADVPTDFWAFGSVKACVDAGIVKGYSDGTYRPADPVTRDQMAVYISRAMAGGDAYVPSGPAAATFTDVPSDYWAYRYVEYAVGHGVVEGYDPTHYRPEVVVDRGQMAVFVARSQGWAKIGDDMAAAPQLFSDVPAGFWSGTAIKACVDNGVVRGYDDGSYRPDEHVTRDQMAVYIARAFKLPL